MVRTLSNRIWRDRFTSAGAGLCPRPAPGFFFRGGKLGVEPMSEVKHTPGPWEAEGTSILSRYAVFPATIVCDVGTRNEAFGIKDAQAVREANARLIAAAPDLLHACESLLCEVDRRCGGKCDGDSSLVSAADAARSAISKATGKVVPPDAT